jgi:hypothetical protein
VRPGRRGIEGEGIGGLYAETAFTALLLWWVFSQHFALSVVGLAFGLQSL